MEVREKRVGSEEFASVSRRRVDANDARARQKKRKTKNKKQKTRHASVCFPPVPSIVDRGKAKSARRFCSRKEKKSAKSRARCDRRKIKKNEPRKRRSANPDTRRTDPQGQLRRLTWNLRPASGEFCGRIGELTPRVGSWGARDRGNARGDARACARAEAHARGETRASRRESRRTSRAPERTRATGAAARGIRTCSVVKSAFLNRIKIARNAWYGRSSWL